MIKIKGKTMSRIRDTGPDLDRVDGVEVARALEASSMDMVGPGAQGPVALYGLRQALSARLRSTGGRPGLGVSRRQKIPLDEADWEFLRELSMKLANEANRPTPGQVASELLRQRLDDLRGQMVHERATLPCRRDRALRDVVGAVVMGREPRSDTIPRICAGAGEFAA